MMGVLPGIWHSPRPFTVLRKAYRHLTVRPQVGGIQMNGFCFWQTRMHKIGNVSIPPGCMLDNDWSNFLQLFNARVVHYELMRLGEF